MPLAPEAPTQNRDLQVRTDPTGSPLAIRYDGRIWLVDPATASEHWFGRDAGRDTRCTADVGSGDPVSAEYWRVRVRLSSGSALRTFTLRRDLLAAQWLLENISDGG